ncbi:MAG: hypothetical protein HGA55_01725 [Methanoregulaceae archaeon]|nr:hypothetical protein [Methanoregulaceae archaeon]
MIDHSPITDRILLSFPCTDVYTLRSARASRADIWLFLLVPWTIFFARYITFLYDSAGPETSQVG